MSSAASLGGFAGRRPTYRSPNHRVQLNQIKHLHKLLGVRVPIDCSKHVCLHHERMMHGLQERYKLYSLYTSQGAEHHHPRSAWRPG